MVAAALRSIKAVVERTFITTRDKGFLGSTSRAVRQGDQLVVIMGCPFVVAIREVEADRVQEVRDRTGLDGSVRVCKVVGKCYVEWVMDAELLQDGYWANHGENVVFI